MLEELLRDFAPTARLLHSWPLHGGVSATVSALEFEQDGEVRKVVVRQYGERDLNRNPNIAAQEFQLLHFLHGAGLQVPQPLHHAPGVLIVEFIEGVPAVELQPDPQQLAQFLASLHALDPSELGIPPLEAVRPTFAQPDDSLSETRIREALARCQPPQPSKIALLHGDFWPGNTLWHAGELAAVIDWEDACTGNPLYDLGVARLELLFFHGAPIMQAFTDEYAHLTGATLSPLPYWDLRAALRPCGFLGYWGLSPQLEARMRERHTWFVQQAFKGL